MYRSISTTRVGDGDYESIYNQSPTSKGVSPVLRALSLEANQFPEYQSSILSEAPSKSRHQFSHKAVHIIPFLLLFCAFFLWIFSNPDIELPVRTDVVKLQAKGAAHMRNSNMLKMGLHNHKLASTMPNL